jgi:malate dehydrogenase (oxaloacetate-decarboxylating)
MSKDFAKLALEVHKKLHGKIEVTSKGTVTSTDDLSTYYTPGVGAVSSYVAEHPEEMREYTIKRNTVAVISDGSAVLGLGNLGANGALPVMEGKAMLFKELGGVDAFPICLDTQDTEEIIAVVKAIAPVFGGINLEDFSAPRCFEIEERLKAELAIPVMHDDQHGTAIVVLAGLVNAMKVVSKNLNDCKVVVVGAGAAGSAVARLIVRYAPKAKVLMVDSKGIVSRSRTDLDKNKQRLAQETNQAGESGSMADAIKGADVFIGVSKPNLITTADVAAMAKGAVIFAMSNPHPEILPDEAKAGGAAVVATGRSDFPNQVNNALAFPGIFRGVLDAGLTQITDDMKLAAAIAIAGLVANPTADEIIPAVLDPRVVPAVAAAMKS